MYTLYLTQNNILTLTTAVLTRMDELLTITTILSWSRIGPNTFLTCVSGNRHMTFLMWERRPVSKFTGTVSAVSFSLRKGIPLDRDTERERERGERQSAWEKESKKGGGRE